MYQINATTRLVTETCIFKVDADDYLDTFLSALTAHRIWNTQLRSARWLADVICIVPVAICLIWSS